MIDHQRKLQKRGIHAQAMFVGWQRSQAYHTQGWQYPIFDLDGGVIATRYKAANRDAKMKYAWVGGKPDHPLADWYILPGTQDAISRAGGVCYLANGEPALLAYHAAGITNVIATTASEVTVPRNLLDLLQTLGVMRLLYPVDNDSAGTTSGIHFRDALQASGIDFEALAWGDDAPAKADANDMWVRVNFDADAFRGILDELIALDLPAPEPKQAYTFEDSHFDETPAGLIMALSARLNVRGWRSNGWSRNVSSPFHEDKNPSFGIHRDSGVGRDFATGENYSPTQIAEQLGIDWRRFYPERIKKKKYAPKSASSSVAITALDQTDIEQAAYIAPAIEADLRCHVRYINEIIDQLPDTGVIVLVSDKGTGKSHCARQLIDRAPADTITLTVSPTQTLAQDSAAKYPVEHYAGLSHSQQAQAAKANGLATTLKSLKHTGDVQPHNLVLDELRSLLQQLGSKIFNGGESSQAFATLQRMIQGADRVLVMDADIDQIEIDFLKDCHDEVFVVVNEYARPAGDCYVYDDASKLQTAFINALAHEERAGRPAIYVANTRQEVETLAEHVENLGYDVLSIHQGNSANLLQRAFIKDPDGQISNYDAVFISPSALQGIDIQTLVYRKFGHFIHTPQWTPGVAGSGQLLERARNADETHVYIQQVSGSQEENADAIYDEALQKGRESVEMAIGLLWDPSRNRYDFDGNLKRLHTVQSRMLARDNAGRNHFRQNLLNLLARNYTLHDAGDASSKHGQAVRDTGDAIKQRWDELVLTAPPISDEEHNDIAAKGELTERVNAGLERWKIQEFYGRDIDEQLYKFDSKGRGRGRTEQFLDVFHRSRVKLEDFDFEEHMHNTPLLMRKHKAKRAYILQGLIRAVWGTRERFEQNDALELETILDHADDFFSQYRSEIELYFQYRHEYKDDVWNTVKRLFRAMGLKFKQVRSRDKEAPKCYRVDPDRLAYLEALAQSRLQMLAEGDRVTKKCINNSNDAKSWNGADVFTDVFDDTLIKML